MTPGTKAVLEYLDRVLEVGDQTSREVADVLTALRGPDNTDGILKEEQTNLIRSVAFPRTAKARPIIQMSYAISPRARVGIPKPAHTIRQTFNYDGHFRAHIERAALALGILFKA